MADLRLTSAKILLAVEKSGAYSSLELAAAFKKQNIPDARDRAFVTALVYGVLERRITLDYDIGLYLKKTLKSLRPEVLVCLRLGAYQLLFTDKIPPSAAVNETVNITGKLGCAYAKGLVNAVLHKIAAAGIVYPDEKDKSLFYSVKMSCPEELAGFFIEKYGEDKADAILSASLGKRPVFIRVNTLKTTADRLTEMLSADGVKAEKTELENCLRIENTGDITALAAYNDGLFFVEDMSSQLCCLLAGVSPGQTVVDCCAAPGGKSFSLAVYAGNRGNIYSCDMYEHKTGLIDRGAARLGINCIKTVCRDARTLNEIIENADTVLCDVPCSGFGVIGRKPEIKEKRLSEIKGLPPLQYEILSSCCKMVRPGGTLVYSTCTLNPEENEENCDKFLKEHPDFSIAQDELYLSYSKGGYVCIIPAQDGGDGFFVAKFTRKQN